VAKGVSQQAVGDHLFTSAAYISSYVARGWIVKTPDGKYDLDQAREGVLRGLRAQAAGRTGNAGVTDLASERAKLTQQQTEAVALKNALAKHEVIYLQDMIDAVVHDILLAKEKLLVMPGKIADSLVGRTRAECEAIIKAEMVEATNEFRDPRDYRFDQRAESAIPRSVGGGVEVSDEPEPDRVGRQVQTRRKEDKRKSR
jgi:hypothetical protein